MRVGAERPRPAEKVRSGHQALPDTLVLPTSDRLDCQFDLGVPIVNCPPFRRLYRSERTWDRLWSSMLLQVIG